MNEWTVANRYADSLLQIALEKNNVEEFIKDMKVVQEVFEKDEQFLQFLQHPNVIEENKLTCIERSFTGISKEIKNTLQLLVQRKRIFLIDYLIDAFLEQAFEKLNRAKILISTAKQLTNDQIEAICNTFAHKLNKESVEAEVEVNNSLIGGLKVHYKNTVYDGTILNQLERLKNSIRTRNY